MADKTPEQRAYEAYWQRISAMVVTPWGDDIPPSERDAWHDSAQAARADLEQQFADELGVTRRYREQLAAVTAERDRDVSDYRDALCAMQRERDEAREQLAAVTAENERIKTGLAALADKWDATAAVPGDVADDPDAYDSTTRAMWDLRCKLYRNHAAGLRKLTDEAVSASPVPPSTKSTPPTFAS